MIGLLSEIASDKMEFPDVLVLYKWITKKSLAFFSEVNSLND